MLKKISLTLIIFTFYGTLYAQKTEDQKAVKHTVLNYIENFFENNYKAMDKSLHPRLVKRGLTPNGEIYEDLNSEKLEVMLSKKKPLPLKSQENKVDDIQIFGKMAKATLTTGYPNMKWKEYMHLVKEEGQWKIINVFWEYFPSNKKQKPMKRKS